MRVAILTLALAAATLNTPLKSYAADMVPDFDIRANCKIDLPDSAGMGETLNKCTDDEQRAKQQLAQDWSRFAQNDKNTCIKETKIDGTPSYVELQTCLQMAHDSHTRLSQPPANAK